MRIYNWKVALIGLILFALIMWGAISFASVPEEESLHETQEQIVPAE